MTGSRRPTSEREVIFELRVVGNAVRIAAVDAETGTEVVVLGPRATSRRELQRLALAKLEKRMNQLESETDETRPGIVV